MDKVFQQHQNVVLPFAKRGNLDREYVQPVVEVRAKCPVGNGGFQIAIRCRYYADIDFNGLRAADALEFTFLQHPQECNLSVQRHLADFVEENSSPVRQFKSTEAALHRPGERALFVAKEFGRNQRWGKSCAVHAHEGALRPTRSLMDGAGDQFLTSSGLSMNKNPWSICSLRARFSLRLLSSARFRSSISVPVAYQRIMFPWSSRRGL